MWSGYIHKIIRVHICSSFSQIISFHHSEDTDDTKKESPKVLTIQSEILLTVFRQSFYTSSSFIATAPSAADFSAASSREVPFTP